MMKKNTGRSRGQINSTTIRVESSKQRGFIKKTISPQEQPLHSSAPNKKPGFNMNQAMSPASPVSQRSTRIGVPPTGHFITNQHSKNAQRYNRSNKVPTPKGHPQSNYQIKKGGRNLGKDPQI